MKIINVILLFLLFLTQTCLAKIQTKYYDPVLEHLNGTVVILTFPGQPNYTSINDGDADETRPYLLLEKPINVKMKSKNDYNLAISFDSEKNIRLVQLILMDDSSWKFMKSGKRIDVTGKLFGAMTGHHHAKVLIEVQKCSFAENQMVQPIKNFKKAIEHSLYPSELDKMTGRY